MVSVSVAEPSASECAYFPVESGALHRNNSSSSMSDAANAASTLNNSGDPGLNGRTKMSHITPCQSCLAIGRGIIG